MLLSGIIEKQLSERIRLTYFDVVEYDDFAECLDRHLPTVWLGPREQRCVEVTKRKVRGYFEPKLTNHPLLCGSCAEIFLHIYLGQNGYQQACLCSNLEEESIKKGFDGFYIKDEHYWLMESKSSIRGNKTHLSKVKEAYRDLCNKIVAFDGNDPWQNALNHAYAAGIDGSIADQIRLLSDDFTLGRVHKAEEFNMIPCGTVFIEAALTKEQVEELSSRAYRFFEQQEYASLHMVCVSHSALVGFLRYLGLEYVSE